jgi:ATP:ADP antiporter, AAA family
VLPASALFMVLYAKMSNSLSKRALFYTTCTPFFVFYALFCTVLYPYREMIQPKVTSGLALYTVPSFCEGSSLHTRPSEPRVFAHRTLHIVLLLLST